MSTDPTATPSGQQSSAAPVDPTTKFQVEIPMQSQPAPGLASELVPPADHGEASYVGHGRLTLSLIHI